MVSILLIGEAGRPQRSKRRWLAGRLVAKRSGVREKTEKREGVFCTEECVTDHPKPWWGSAGHSWHNNTSHVEGDHIRMWVSFTAYQCPEFQRCQLKDLKQTFFRICSSWRREKKGKANLVICKLHNGLLSGAKGTKAPTWVTNRVMVVSIVQGKNWFLSSTLRGSAYAHPIRNRWTSGQPVKTFSSKWPIGHIKPSNLKL